MTPAESKKGEDQPLTAADLDRLEALHREATPGEWVCETRTGARLPAAEEAVAVVAPRGWRHTVLFGDVRVRSNVADRNLAVAARNALPALLALARRGLEAEAELRAEQDASVGHGLEVDALRAANRAAESKLAAALAELERAKARLAKAHAFWLAPSELGPRLGIESRQQRDGSIRWVVTFGGHSVIAKNGERVMEPIPSERSDEYIAATRFDTLDAAWSAAEAQSARTSAPKGGPA